MNEDDFIIHIYRNSIPNIDMKIIHIPTNLWVHGTGKSSFKLKEKLMNELKEKIKNVWTITINPNNLRPEPSGLQAHGTKPAPDLRGLPLCYCKVRNAAPD